MNELYLQIGVGGIFAIQIVRMVLDALPKLLSTRRNGNGHGGKSSGDMDPAFWQLEFRKAVSEGVSSSIVLARQTEILSDIKDLQKELLNKDPCCRHCED